MGVDGKMNVCEMRKANHDRKVVKDISSVSYLKWLDALYDGRYNIGD